jgi:hypothetical protein
MQIEMLKFLTIGPRVLEPGFLIDTKTMAFMSDERAKELVEEGVAVVKQQAKKLEKEKEKDDA